MKRLFVPLCLGLVSFSLGCSDDFQKSVETYDKSDYETALKKWRTLAEQGNAKAQFNLGQMYRNEKGIPQDYKTAVKWYTLSSEQNFAEAQANLGVMYYNGWFVIKDIVYAHMWANIASSNGFEHSKGLLESFNKEMTPSQIKKHKD